MAKPLQKILICDDEKGILKMLESRLKANHYQVVTANNGSEALAKAQSEKPDLIILDLAMPDLNGYQVSFELKKDPQFKETPIIILSAWVRDKLGDKNDLGDVYLLKPYEPEVLMKEIKLLLASGIQKSPEAS